MAIKILMFLLGNIVGSASTVVIIALLKANKREDVEYEKLEKYKQGYEKGYKDASALF